MANTGVKGRIVYAGTSDGVQGIKDIEIHAVDYDPISGDDHLGSAKTDKDGYFEISYFPSDTYRLWIADRNPDIMLRIYGPSQRLLYETSEYSNVEDTVLNIEEPIEIHEKNVTGWLVTNTTLNPADGTPKRLTQGNQLEYLIDGAIMFPKLTDEVIGAETSINFMNLNIWPSNNLITKFEEDFDFKNPPEGSKVLGKRIHTILKEKAEELFKADEPSKVNVIVNNIYLFDGVDSFDEVKEYFEGSKVKPRGFSGVLSYLHAKTVTIDGMTAFVLGSPIGQNYFNDDQHSIYDARHRGSLTHDVSLLVKGPVVEHIDRTFTTIWNESDSSTPSLLPAVGQSPVPGSDVGIQVVRTLPGGDFNDSHTPEDEGGIPHGETGILEAYQRAIANANDLIYIEDQYFTSPEIVRALISRMKEVPGLQVIIVLNIEPDVPGYPQKQTSLIKKLQGSLKKIQTSLGQQNERLGVFTLWNCDASKSPFEIMPIYVHSKAAVMDDYWATVGSANLDGASMNQLQVEGILDGVSDKFFDRILEIVIQPVTVFIMLLLRLVHYTVNQIARPTQHANPKQSLQPSRHVELNLVIYNDVDGLPHTDGVSDLRKKLWEEHLGELPDTVPEGGWVKYWKNQAAEKLEKIKKAENHPAKILEWKPYTSPEKYLRKSGIKTRELKVRKYGGAPKFDFETGKWASE